MNSALLATASNHLLSVLARPFGDFEAAKHARHFIDPRLIFQFFDMGCRVASDNLFMNHVMGVSERRYLGQVRDANDLVRGCHSFEPLADNLSHAATDAGVYLIEQERRNIAGREHQ